MERLAVRCRIVVPENSMRLPGHMSLTSKLLASPRALTRIQLYCKGRLGYIVPGMLGPEEVHFGQASLDLIWHLFEVRSVRLRAQHAEGMQHAERVQHADRVQHAVCLQHAVLLQHACRVCVDGPV